MSSKTKGTYIFGVKVKSFQELYDLYPAEYWQHNNSDKLIKEPA